MEAARIPTEAVSAEIVPFRRQPEDSPINMDQLDEIERMIPAAIEARATKELYDLASQAEAASLYQARQGYKSLADRCSRLKIHAEAAIGLLDVRDCPTHAERPAPLKEGPILVHGYEVRAADMSMWRGLGIALDRGALDVCMASALEMRTGDVYREATRMGVTYVPLSAFASKVASEAARLSTNGLERSLPQHRAVLRRIVRDSKRVGKSRTRMTYSSAKALAEAFGMDPATLPFAPTRGRRGASRPARRWLSRERKPTGSRWDKCYVEFRKCLATFGQLAPDQDVIWDEAYEHFKAIEDLLGKQMQRDRQR